MGELFNAMRKDGQERRANNRENSAAMLLERGISFESCNGGAHLIVSHGGKVVDFWPGTGKWLVRGAAMRGFRYGVRPLIAEVTRDDEVQRG